MAALALAAPAAFAAEPAQVMVAAHDETPNLLTDTWSLSLGTYIVSSKPTVQLNGKTIRGDKVDFDKALGGGDSTRFRFDGAWRFGDTDRHQLKTMWFNVNRSRTDTINREINWGDNTYPVDAKVDFSFKFNIIELAYEYEFLKRENYEIGASFGLYYAGLDSQLKLKGATQQAELRNKASVDLPLPVFGLQGTWDLGHDFWFNASGQFFSLTIDQYSGDIQDYRALFMWQPKKWVGVGVGYDRFSVNVDVNKDKFDGSLDWTYDGPMIFYHASF